MLISEKRLYKAMPKMLLIIAIFNTLCLPAFSQTNVWKIDEKTSSVEFSVKHLMVSNVSGRFSKFAGTVNFDGKDLTSATVLASISTGSIDTKNQMRDKHLKAEDILGAVLFPTITFTSKRVVPASDGSFDVIGNLNLHGVDREVTLHAAPLKFSSKQANNERHATTTATAAIERKGFNVFVDKAVDKGGTLVGETVKVKLKIDLIEASLAEQK